MSARRKLLFRPVAVLLAVLGPAALSASCGSDDDEIVNSQPKPKSSSDASSSGGSNGFAGTGGSSGAGTFGTGGSSGGGNGGSSGGGTCSPDFCPTNGVATPCCVVPGVGPCGFDYGMGCQGGEPRNDF